MNYFVFFFNEDGNAKEIGTYNNYDLESGYMEHSIISRIKSLFPNRRIERDNAGLVFKVDDTIIHIQPY